MTHRERLLVLACASHGVVTTGAAQTAGVPAVEVRRLAARGLLARIGRGVYRMHEAPVTSMSEFAEAVALAGDGAVLVDEAVLSAHGLAQVNLRRIRVATPRRVRAKVPETVEIVRRRVPPDQRDSIDGVPAMTIEAALLTTRGRVMTERLVTAAHDAADRGLLDPEQEARVVAALTEDSWPGV